MRLLKNSSWQKGKKKTRAFKSARTRSFFWVEGGGGVVARSSGGIIAVVNSPGRNLILPRGGGGSEAIVAFGRAASYARNVV